MVTKVDSAKADLESQISILKANIRETEEEHRRSESHAVLAIKEKERVIEVLTHEMSEKGLTILEANEVIDEFKTRSQELNA